MIKSIIISFPVFMAGPVLEGLTVIVDAPYFGRNEPGFSADECFANRQKIGVASFAQINV
ncbi:MAG: hypothetical protein MJB12_09360 [Firmicutes bacterium]|nr:hypothetical protein [Bacillota bacterium]